MEGVVCPVCMAQVSGDPDFVDAHVDACLVREASLQDERAREDRAQRDREAQEEVDIDGDLTISVIDGVNLQGEHRHQFSN